jgi:hypothetical protein
MTATVPRREESIVFQDNCTTPSIHLADVVPRVTRRVAFNSADFQDDDWIASPYLLGTVSTMARLLYTV